MTGRLLTVCSCLLLSSCAALDADHDGPIAYDCNEVVVVGRVHAIGAEDATTEGDLLGHGLYAMRISVKRVLRGKETRRVLPASGYSHGPMRQDADFWMVLVPATGGGYMIRAANLTRFPYRLAPACG